MTYNTINQQNKVIFALLEEAQSREKEEKKVRDGIKKRQEKY